MSSENNSICTVLKQELWLYLSHELPAQRQEFWEKHLHTCENCHINVQEIKATLDVYGKLPPAELDENWYIQAVEHATRPMPRRTFALFSTRSRKVAVTALALAAAILLFFILPRKQDISDSLAWEDSSMDSIISEIDSTLSSFAFDGEINYVVHLNYEYEDESLESKIDELQKSLQLLAEDLQNSM